MIASKDVVVHHPILDQDMQIMAGTEVPKSLIKVYEDATGETAEKAEREPATSKAEVAPERDKADVASSSAASTETPTSTTRKPRG